MKRFDDKIISKKKCWIWGGAINASGYGLFKFNGETRLAHRVSFMINIGSIAKGFYVLHKCDNPACVNPKHLYIGTQKDNMLDMMNRGRSRAIKLLVLDTKTSKKKTFRCQEHCGNYFGVSGSNINYCIQHNGTLLGRYKVFKFNEYSRSTSRLKKHNNKLVTV